jgi:hypothetical protein
MNAQNFSPADVRYIVANFRRLSPLCEAWGISETVARSEMERRLLPGASYILPGCAEYYPDDYFAFPLAAAPGNRRDHFFERFMRTCERYRTLVAVGDCEQAWEDYLSGVFGICLRVVLPETIVAKVHLITVISELIAAPNPSDNAWRDALNDKVNALDTLLRPFTQCDRLEGAPVSRDLYVDAVRQRFKIESAHCHGARFRT